ncbi:MAG: (2Fe-2S)-binding protein [Treponema sp.]|nr:(2Fe-2S)-binding protein [Treponema sp.]
MSHKPDPDKSVNLTIDGIPVTAPEGTKILEAARKANVLIPTLCDHPDLCRRAVCRICVVECDGKGKLLAACSNDVWEGVNIVTNNSRIANIRKTIIELLLANHPQECLSCARSTDCKLQSLAEIFGIRETSFRRGAMNRQPVTGNGALLRDMDKCVKCGRCVEACQEIQTVRAINSSHRSVNYRITTAYCMSLEDSLCVSCGQCETVCPVGSLYENDQSADAWAAINNAECRTAAQISKTLCTELDNVFGFTAGTVSPGKAATALKRLGFDKVYDSKFAEDLAAAELSLELRSRVKNNGKQNLPIISACSQSAIRFMENFYPDLAALLSPCRSPREIFASMMKEEKTTSVSIEPCISNKNGLKQQAGREPDITLTVKELARMFRITGIDIASLPESPFDSINAENGEAKHGVKELTADLKGIKCLTANGLGKARTLLDSVRKGECDASLIEIRSCPLTDSRARCASICYTK